MVRYAAFLRAVNLGSRRRVGAAQLRAEFEAMGFEDAESFRTSGNVVFATGGERPDKLTARIEAALAGSLGYAVTIFLRTEDEVRAIAAHEPFSPALVTASKGKLQVSLLGAEPTAAVSRAVLKLATDDDRLTFAGRELYWLPSGGTRDSAVDARALDKLLGPTTMRTKGTLELLAKKFFMAQQ